jgi:hypothetical protein
MSKAYDSPGSVPDLKEVLGMPYVIENTAEGRMVVKDHLHWYTKASYYISWIYMVLISTLVEKLPAETISRYRKMFYIINKYAIEVKNYGERKPDCVTYTARDIIVSTHDKRVISDFKENCLNPSIEIFRYVQHLRAYLEANIDPVQILPGTRHECSICATLPQAWVVQCPNHESHQFDMKCIYDWYAICHNSKKEFTCPICRTELTGTLRIFKTASS